MSVSDRYVVTHPDGWAVRREGAKMASSVHNTQARAIVAGISAIMNSGGGELYILNRDGEVRESVTVGPTNDPFPPRGQHPSAADGAPAGEPAASADTGRTASRSAAEILSMICGSILKAMPWLGGRDQSKPALSPDGGDREFEEPSNRRYVVRHPDGWAVKAGRKRASSVHVTRDEAIVVATSYLSNTGGGELIIRNQAGEIQHRFTVPPRNCPFPPRGQRPSAVDGAPAGESAASACSGRTHPGGQPRFSR